MNFRVSIFTLILLASCNLSPTLNIPKIEVPDSWEKKTLDIKNNDLDEKQWWGVFKDDQLNKLIAKSLTDNYDIKIALNNLSKSEEFLNLANSKDLPNLGLQANAQRIKHSKEQKLIPYYRPVNLFNFVPVLSYELDLWGKIASQKKEALALLLASESNKQALQLMITSEITISYFNLISLQRQQDLLSEIIKINKKLVAITSKSEQVGVADKEQIIRASSFVNQAQGELSILRQKYQEQEAYLAILLGSSPKEIWNFSLKNNKETFILPIMPKIMPSDLLQNRPDISSAEQQIIAANYSIGVARAQFFPSLSLTGLLGLETSDLTKLLKSSAFQWQTQGGIALPVFNPALTKATVAISEARKQEAIINYQKVVANAFKEVLTAISAQNNLADNLKKMQDNENNKQEILHLAKVKFKAGIEDITSVLMAEQLVLQAKLATVQAQQAKISATVGVIKALGGKW